MLRDGWWTAFSEMLIRRSALEAALRDQPLPPDVGPDTFLNLRIALAGWTHVLVDGRLSRRRWHASQLSRTFPDAVDMSVATFRRLSIADPILAAARDRQLARSHLVRALRALRAGDVLAARVDVGAAASIAPAAWRAERRALALAAACGPAGVLAARLWAASSPRGRSGSARPIGSGTADRARYSSAGIAAAAPPNRVATTSPAMISAAPIAFHRSIGSCSQIAGGADRGHRDQVRVDGGLRAAERCTAVFHRT